MCLTVLILTCLITPEVLKEFPLTYERDALLEFLEFPMSCSMATTNIGDRIVNATQAAFAEFGKGYGLAEGSMGMGIGAAVISGKDRRFGGAPYINQEWLVVNGGPGTPTSDGWLNYGLPVAAGLMYRGSVEVEESKHPILVKHMRVIPGGGGAGEFRGAPGADVMYGPRFGSYDCCHNV